MNFATIKKTKKQRRKLTDEEKQQFANKYRETKRQNKEKEMKLREEKILEIHKQFNIEEQIILQNRIDKLHMKRQQQKKQFIQNLTPELAEILYDKINELEDFIFAKQLEYNKYKKIKEYIGKLDTITN